MSFFKWLSDKTSAPKVQVDLTVQKCQYCLGDQVTGEVKITSEEEFEVSQAAIWFTCKESLKKMRTFANQYGSRQEEYWDEAAIFRTSQTLLGAARISQGFNGVYKFDFLIPTVARETFYSVDHYVKWFLQPTLEVRGRPQIQPKMYEVLVAKPQAVPAEPEVVKEVVREVVLIPCAYCSSLMPQSSIFCPNCGARRKT